MKINKSFYSTYKSYLILSIVSVGLFISFEKYTTMTANKTETQPYKVLRKEKDFEIRFYPAATMATITSSAKSYKELSSAGFRQLAGYIFGGNKGSQKIAMTTPVHMDINDSASSMSFVMPAAYNKDNLPVPDDSEVTIKTTNEEYVAAIQFGGYASDKDIKLYAEKLKTALDTNAISYYGNFRFLGYNAPYELFWRRNEVIVSVKWDLK